MPILQTTLLLKAMASLGWVSEIMMLRGHEYGALTRRKRAWLVCVHCARCGISVACGRNLVKRISALVGQMKIDPLPADCFMLPDDDPYLSKLFAPMDPRQQLDTEDKSTRWQADVVKSLEKHGLTWSDLKMRKDLLQSPSIQALSERAKACLSFNLLLQPSAMSIDVGQGHERALVGCDEVFPTFIPRAAYRSLPYTGIRYT